MSTETRLRAESILRRNTRDLEEAKKIPGADALVAMLDERVSSMRKAFDLADCRAGLLTEAEAAKREADAELAAARAAHQAGSLDPVEAVQLRDAAEASEQKARILSREAEAAAAAAAAPFQRVIKYSSDQARGDAEHAIDAVLSAAREGGDRLSSHVRDAIPRHRGQASAVWLVFFAARGLTLYQRGRLRAHPQAVGAEVLRQALDHLVSRCNAE